MHERLRGQNKPPVQSLKIIGKLHNPQAAHQCLWAVMSFCMPFWVRGLPLPQGEEGWEGAGTRGWRQGGRATLHCLGTLFHSQQRRGDEPWVLQQRTTTTRSLHSHAEQCNTMHTIIVYIANSFRTGNYVHASSHIHIVEFPSTATVEKCSATLPHHPPTPPTHSAGRDFSCEGQLCNISLKNCTIISGATGIFLLPHLQALEAGSLARGSSAILERRRRKGYH